MITFIHTADIHFGMENYGKIDSQSGIHTRLLDFERALNFCIDYAIEQQVDFFLFAGDAYKTAHPTPTQQRLLLKCFLRLYNAHIPVVMVVGNHDQPITFGKAHALSIFSEIPIEGFHVIAQPTSFSLDTKNGPIQIVGIPWPNKAHIALNNTHTQKTSHELVEHISNRISEIINYYAHKLDPKLPAILTGHLTVNTGIFSGSEKRAIYGSDPMFLPSQLAIHPFDYVALGHLHRYQNLNPTGHPPLVYSGSLERIDFGERKEEKGFCMVTIKEKKNTEISFIKTPTRPFIQIEVQIKPDEEQTKQILSALKKYSILNAIIKIIYYIPENELDKVNLSKVESACATALYCAGIIPRFNPKIRECRAMLDATMNLDCLLTEYFSSKQTLINRKESLLKLAHEIINSSTTTAY